MSLQYNKAKTFSPTIVPEKITPTLIHNFEKLGSSNAYFVDVVNRLESLPNKCVLNAKQEAEDVDGNVILGWAVFIWESVYVQYIGHAIVGLSDERYCVTPTKNGEPKILFIEDESLSFDFNDKNARLPSKMIPISKHKSVIKLIEIEEKLYELKSKYPVSSTTIELSINDSEICKNLQKERKKCIDQVVYLYHPKTSDCVCGSGKQYRKCCRPAMKRYFGKPKSL